MTRALVALLVALALTACSGGAADEPVPPSTSPSAATAPTPTATPSQEPTPQEEFAAEVEELYALVKESVEGSTDYAASADVLAAFATTVALVRVEPEQTADRQGVVDAAETAAESYRTAAGITNGIERTAAARQAVVRLRELERVTRTLPTQAPSPTATPSPTSTPAG